MATLLLNSHQSLDVSEETRLRIRHKFMTMGPKFERFSNNRMAVLVMGVGITYSMIKGELYALKEDVSEIKGDVKGLKSAVTGLEATVYWERSTNCKSA
ncbi:MAG: hypothetical protein Q9198_004158 [Flavoplaca austrocitrina]